MIMHKICKECANYDHKNLKHTKACGNCVTEHYKDGTESDPSNWRALPQTNADRIRSMSDEELAKWLCGISTAECCDRSCPARDMCDFGDSGMIKWLKQPAEGE